MPGCLLGAKTEAALLSPFPAMQWWELVGSKLASSLPPALGLKLKRLVASAIAELQLCPVVFPLA